MINAPFSMHINTALIQILSMFDAAGLYLHQTSPVYIWIYSLSFPHHDTDVYTLALTIFIDLHAFNFAMRKHDSQRTFYI